MQGASSDLLRKLKRRKSAGLWARAASSRHTKQKEGRLTQRSEGNDLSLLRGINGKEVKKWEVAREKSKEGTTAETGKKDDRELSGR